MSYLECSEKITVVPFLLVNSIGSAEHRKEDTGISVQTLQL